MKMVGKPKRSRFKPTTRPLVTIKDVQEKLANFDPQKAVDNYLAQDPEQHTLERNPAFLWDREEVHETQATRVIKKFGGIRETMAALRAVGFPLTRQALYQWTWESSRGGTNGIIPTKAWPYIYAAARLAGVLLTPDEVDARPAHLRKFTAIAKVVDGQVTPFLNFRDRKALALEEARRLRSANMVAGHRKKVWAMRQEIKELRKKVAKLERLALSNIKDTASKGKLSK